MIGKTNADERLTQYSVGTPTFTPTDHPVTYAPSALGCDYFGSVTVEAVPINPYRQICLGQSVRFTPALVGDDLTEVPDYLFYKRPALVEVVMPRAMRTIGAYGFYNTGMTSLVIDCSNLTSMGNTSFSNNASLQTLYINAPQLATVPDSLFSSCYALRTAELHIGVMYNRFFTVARNLYDLLVGAECAHLGLQVLHLNVSEHSQCPVLDVTFLRSKQVDALGNVVQDVPTLNDDAIGDRAVSKFRIHVPADSLMAYRLRFGETTRNARYVDCIYPFADCAAGDTLPTSLTQSDAEHQGVYQIAWYTDKAHTTAVQSLTVNAAGRYYGLLTSATETTIE